MNEAEYWGGIETGGTKFVCAVGTGPDDIRAEARIPTTTPEETLEEVLGFFRRQAGQGPPAAVGIASFGPVDLDPGSPTYGFTTTTTKPGWSNVDVAGTIARGLGVPVGFDTDVNGAALGENRWGAARGLDTFIYLTVGTGIGGGGMCGGNLLHGLVHPEMGHAYVPHDLERDPFPGSCPYHGDCLEGLASGRALERRWGRRGETLPPDHPAWQLEAHYLSLALANYIFTLSPRRIVMGGGVTRQEQLFPAVRSGVTLLLKGYLQSPALLQEVDDYIVPPGLGNRSGVLGAIALARLAAPAG
jgi:fructokinase